MNRELIHVYPVNDLREHEHSENCWCKPIVLESADICIHHAMDQRDSYENSELKMH
ncbi:hypothetical protein NMV02_10975 [Pasteurella multocida]|uniref:hypothetical protein n=1 Tax=Pasteurella multocida TaxID=747 RepID=UPI0020205541|nr:hypothetical protein [Pasteurella multocida]MCL7790080.1 hypothetical protein [Pasteurella multocida]MDY0501295.1 hypothetical protein [Pasteurella multocida]MDY0531932.1 hypothetical protein [Pasteurella multocida]MDY0587595.1 hypothetical protein [Pasteurella multocida]MDY0602361.1 hypothetical protein [Pasteurella multocida]